MIFLTFLFFINSSSAEEWRGPFDYDKVSVSFKAGKEKNGDPIYIGMVLHENIKMKGVNFIKRENKYVQEPRDSYKGKWVLGRWTKQYGGVVYTNNNEEHFAKKFLIFDPINAKAYSWIKANDGELPANAVQAWSSNDDQYICRAEWAGGIYPGRFVPSNQVCIISFSGKEVKLFVYEILVVLTS